MRSEISRKYRLTFERDVKGFGDLILWDDTDVLGVWFSRSGSIDIAGNLVNCIEEGLWYMVREPERAAEMEKDKMRVDTKPGIAWKQRLWPIPVPSIHDPVSHFLIHPDGGRPGSEGCVVTQNTNAMDLYYWLNWFFAKHTDNYLLTLAVTKNNNHNKP